MILYFSRLPQLLVLMVWTVVNRSFWAHGKSTNLHEEILINDVKEANLPNIKNSLENIGIGKIVSVNIDDGEKTTYKEYFY